MKTYAAKVQTSNRCTHRCSYRYIYRCREIQLEMLERCSWRKVLNLRLR